MLGAIFNSLSGMNAFTKGLNILSNNVSNMNTPGFKLSDALFRDLVHQFGAGVNNDSSPAQTTGAGVSVEQSSVSLKQGELRTTGNDLDAAINGSGFFVVDNNGQLEYTRAGQFEFDKDGILIESGTGAKVVVGTDTLAFGSFDLNTVRVFPPRATTEVKLSGALMRTSATPTAYSLPQIQVYDTTGAAMQLTAKFTPVTDAPAHVTTAVKLSGTLARGAGGNVAPTIGGTDATFITGSGSALNDSSGGSYTSGPINIFDYSLAANGKSFTVDGRAITLTTDDVDMQGLVADVQSQLDAAAADQFAVSSSVDQLVITKILSGAPDVVDGYTISPVQIFDTTGASMDVSIKLTPDVNDPRHWTVEVVNDADAVMGSGNIRFGDDGTPASGNSSVSINITPPTGPVFAVNFDFGAAGTTAGVTSAIGTTDTELQVLSQDGSAPVKADPLRWKVDVVDSNNEVQGSGSILFNSDGTPSPDGSSMNVTLKPDGSSEFDVRLNFGEPGTYTGVTSVSGTATSQLQVVKQDGAALGTITKTEFDEHGQIKISYSNGETKTPAKLVLAQFDAPDQLRALGGSHFTTVGTQRPVFGVALAGGNGSIAGGQVEMSNVDLTDQMTNLIILQRGFQGCSQITSVANEMMQQLLAMNGGR